MLTAADLEVNVLEFRQRAFQFDRLVELEGGPHAVFTRTETESERQLRPKLVRLAVVVPLAWLVYDDGTDQLRVGRDGTAAPAAPEPAVEVAAEPPEFDEQGTRWRRSSVGPSAFAYAPLELADRLLAPAARARLGLGDAAAGSR